MELLAEAGNYAAFQRLYGGPSYGVWPYQGGSTTQPSAADLYFRQAAAVAATVSTLQKPLAYRLYPGVPSASHSLPNPGLPAYYLPDTARDETRRSRTPDSQPESVDVVEDSSNSSPPPM